MPLCFVTEERTFVEAEARKEKKDCKLALGSEQKLRKCVPNTTKRQRNKNVEEH